MRTVICRILLCVVSVCLLLLSVACGTGGAEGLSVVFYKIGKADAMLITGTDTAGGPFSVLVDTGETDDAPEIIEKVQAAGVETLDCLILTHFDKDHIGGFPALLSEIPAKTVLLPDYVGEGEAYDAMAARLAVTEGVRVLAEDTAFTFGDAAFSVSVPKCAVYEKKQDNNSSLCVTLTYGRHTLLLAGDAESERQAELLSTGLSPCTLLKVPHHGVWNKGLDAFFAACAPAYAVITDSDKNPAEEKTLDALRELGAQIYETRNGDIRVRLTADTVTVTQ